MNAFSELGVAEPLRRAVLGAGYLEPTPIQKRAIPVLLKGGDLLGVAQTGTGKTAAFVLPILQRLAAAAPSPNRGPSALILAPTRELAIQIGVSIATYAKHSRIRHTVIYGGVGQTPQVDALRRGVDIVVATPGRLLDLIGQRCIQLGGISILVLDEADRMLDMGFIRDVRRILAVTPKQRQSMLFSATMPTEIDRLAADFLRDPTRIEVAPAGTAVEQVEQRVFHVATAEKRNLLVSLLRDEAMARVIIFTRTKHGANRLADQLARSGVSTAAIHGEKSQTARQRALEDLRTGRSRVLVATDIAARGIDVKEVTHIVNYELPNVPETYVHRIGRTGRAGERGVAISLCDTAERPYLHEIQKLIRRTIDVAERPDGVERVDPSAASAAARGGGRSTSTERASTALGQGERPPHRETRPLAPPASDGRRSNRNMRPSKVDDRPSRRRRSEAGALQASPGAAPRHRRKDAGVKV